MTTIKPCPFCHCKTTGLSTQGTMFFITCSGCGVKGPGYESQDGAITMWNRRPEEDQWKEASVYLASIHAANCTDYEAKSVSKSKKDRQIKILQECVNALSGGSIQRVGCLSLEDMVKATLERCDNARRYIMETILKK